MNSSTAMRNDSTRAKSLKERLRVTPESGERRTRSRAEAKAAMDRAVLLCEGQGVSFRAASKMERVSREILATRVKIPPRRKRSIPDDDVRALVKALDTMTAEELAEQRDVSTRTLRRTLRRAGVQALRPGRRKKAKATGDLPAFASAGRSGARPNREAPGPSAGRSA